MYTYLMTPSHTARKLKKAIKEIIEKTYVRVIDISVTKRGTERWKLELPKDLVDLAKETNVPFTEYRLRIDHTKKTAEWKVNPRSFKIEPGQETNELAFNTAPDKRPNKTIEQA